MARFFDRWFTKNPKFDDAITIIERSFDELVKKNKLHEEAWGLGHLDRWDLSFTDGTISFITKSGFQAIAAVQVVGTFNTIDNSFLWAWDHPSIPAELATASLCARAFGEKYDLEDYKLRMAQCDEETAWEYAAVTNHLAELQGVYRAPSDARYIFLAFGEVEFTSASLE